MIPRAWALSVALGLLTTAHGTAQEATCDATGWEEVVAAHLARYPLMGVEDAYKLVHQGVFGTEHAAPDLASARAVLEDELGRLDPAAGGPEPLVEPIAPEGRVVRVHLRPYVAPGRDPDALLIAFLQTAASVRGGIDELRCAADVVERLTESRWAPGVWRDFVERMIAGRLPAIHHSFPFETTYRPAYRVVSDELLSTLGLPPGR